jgi:iron complex transport system substrate-binding protein
VSARAAAAFLLGASLAAAGCMWTGPSAGDATAEDGPPPRRIVALTAGSVDVLASLGELDRVVGVEENCFVPGTEGKARIRNDDRAGAPKSLDVEAILALRPDAVVAKEGLRPALEGRGLRVLWVPQVADLESVAPTVERIGALVGKPDRARELVERMRSRMREVRGRTAGLPRVRVYYEAGPPGRTAGSRTIVGAMIDLAGGENVAGGLPGANPTLSAEAIRAADPEVIVLSPWSESPEAVAARPGWDRIAAVRNGRVHRIPATGRRVGYPSPGCVDGCEETLIPWFHPNLVPAAPAARGSTEGSGR